MTKGQLAGLVLTKEELTKIDFALPDMFVVDCKNLLNIDPKPFYVFSYMENKFGKPVNLAELFYFMYQHVPDLVDAVRQLLIDAIDRGECWDTEQYRASDHRKENMYNDWRAVANALDQIDDDRQMMRHNVTVGNYVPKD